MGFYLNCESNCTVRVTSSFRGDCTDSFPIDLNTNILENTTPFLHIAATLVRMFLQPQELEVLA